MKRADRIARQDRDDGAPDDDVYRQWRSEWNAAYAYHEDRECRKLASVPDDAVELITREAAQRKWLAPCAFCVLESVLGNARPNPEVDDVA